jgi:deoxyribodipyrimidine photo-lyase
MWFRRDPRLADNPALLAAVSDAADGRVVPLFVLDPALSSPAGPARSAYLAASLADLGTRVGGLRLRRGDPVHEVVDVARAARARTVHVTEDFGPHGRQRDLDVEAQLAHHGISLVRTGSPYAVPPGRVLNKTGGHYQVFTPYSGAWRDHGWPTPAMPPGSLSWVRPLESHSLGDAVIPAGLRLPPAGEPAAHRRLQEFLAKGLDDYPTTRDRADVDGTSRMSVHLKWGEIHPRTMLADLARHRGAGAAAYGTELAWREFYADVLWRSPASAREYLKPEFAGMEHDEPGSSFTAWCDGLTGYPIVDAGMRQLRAEGWMHNRVRMIVASFLVKDLHIEWRHGARTSWGGCSMVTSPPTRTDGNGWPAAAPTPRHTSGSSTPLLRARGSTLRAATSAGMFPSCVTWTADRFTTPGLWTADHPAAIRPRSWTTAANAGSRCAVSRCLGTPVDM